MTWHCAVQHYSQSRLVVIKFYFSYRYIVRLRYLQCMDGFNQAVQGCTFCYVSGYAYWKLHKSWLPTRGSDTRPVHRLRNHCGGGAKRRPAVCRHRTQSGVYRNCRKKNRRHQIKRQARFKVLNL